MSEQTPTSEASSSPVASSPSQTTASLPTLLPEPPKGKRGRKPFPRDANGNIIRPAVVAANDGVKSVTPLAGDVGAEVRPLPTEPDAMMKAIMPYGIMAKPAVIATSHVLEVVGSTPLNKDEEKSLETAGAAFLYQYFPQFDSRVMLAMAIFGIALPRLAIAVKEMREEKKREREALSGKLKSVEADNKAA